MLNLVILLLTYVFIIIFGFIKGFESEKDAFSGETFVMELFLVFTMIATFIITTYLTAENETSIGWLTLFVTAMDFIVFIISWEAKPIYNKLFLEDKKVKNKSIGKILRKNYSRQHADLILKFYKLLINGKYAKKQGNSNFYLQTIGEYENKKFSYNDYTEPYRIFNSDINIIIELMIKFININIKYANKKEYTESVEEILLRKDNIKRIVFILNVLEDKEKMNFLSTNKGITQLKIIANDLIIINKSITENIDVIIDLAIQTKANKMNQDFNLLRKNSFDYIEEMRRD